MIQININALIYLLQLKSFPDYPAELHKEQNICIDQYWAEYQSVGLIFTLVIINKQIYILANQN